MENQREPTQYGRNQNCRQEVENSSWNSKHKEEDQEEEHFFKFTTGAQ